jgi:hypothetical protein
LFSDGNENFATDAIEGALPMAGDSVNLSALQAVVAKSGVDILPTECGIRRAMRAVSKNWWCPFGYDYVMAAIHVKHENVLVYS